MNELADAWISLKEFALAHPVNLIAVCACALALFSTPIGFAILGRQQWFQARRGRVSQRPAFGTVVVATLLVMGIPAIVLALMVKSQYFDRDRYEFDPNRIPSVLDQGRQYEAHSLLESAYKVDDAVRAEQERLAAERKALVEAVKQLDQAMLSLGEAAVQVQPTADAMPAVVQALAKARKAVGVDAQPRWQELVAILNDPERRLAMLSTAPAASSASTTPQPAANGLTQAQIEQELTRAPAPQRPLATFLPLTDVPVGWVIGQMGDGHLETFNAENLYEKINGRAESFTQYSVTGMAYTNYHPKGDEESGEIQLYIYEFANSLKAFGKYGSEKPAEAQSIAIGAQGYFAAGSVSFLQDKYFVQVVSTSDEPRFAEFSQAIAQRVSAKLPGGTPAPTTGRTENSTREPTNAQAVTDPTALFQHLPDQPNRQQPQYVAQDAFGYSFLSDVFLADYKDGETSWQAFLRPYESPAAARAVFEKYVDTAKADGAQIRESKTEDADRMIECANIGLFDVVFLKGNTVAGVNGATRQEPALAFARLFAKNLPAQLPSMPSGASTDKTAKDENHEP